MIVDTTIGVNREAAKVEILHVALLTRYSATQDTTYQALVRVLEPAHLAGEYVLSSPCGNWAYAYHNNPRKEADFFCIGLGWWELRDIYDALPVEKISKQPWAAMSVADGILALSQPQ